MTTATATATAPACGAAVVEARDAASSPVAWRPGLRAGLVSGVATTAVAAAATAADVPLEVAGEAIPLVGFFQLTLVCVAVGVLIARVLSRRARHAERTW